MNLKSLKQLFLQVLIGCLIAAAIVAVFAVLAGHFNDILGKALITIILIAVHSLLSFGFIVNNEKQETFDNLGFFTNATFLIIVLSFITSILGTWRVLSGDVIGKLYALYFVLLFASLHGDILAKTLKKEARIDKIVYTNYVFMAVVVVMLLPVIFVSNRSGLSSIFYRILAAAGIIDATLTLIAVILNKLYVQRHPAIVDPVFNLVPGSAQAAQAVPVKKHRIANIFVALLIGYIALQFLFFLAIILIGKIK